MRLLKFMGKVLAFPVMLIVTVIQWLFTLMVGLSSVGVRMALTSMLRERSKMLVPGMEIGMKRVLLT